jgi:hypothetical protein
MPSVFKIGWLIHTKRFNAGQGALGRLHRLETQHRANDAFDRPMILFHDIVEIAHLANFNLSVMLSVIAGDGRGIGPTRA